MLLVVCETSKNKSEIHGSFHNFFNVFIPVPSLDLIGTVY